MDPLDVLILNTAVLDLRSREFEFVRTFVGPGGLARCAIEQLPRFSEADYARWIAHGATAGGPGNVAPLLARAGLRVGVGAFLGAGRFEGFDLVGHVFRERLKHAGVDVTALMPHPSLPSAVTFIYEAPEGERGGIAYFANANEEFDFGRFLDVVASRRPAVVHYMYSGLSRRGDAREGRDLGEFMAACRRLGAKTMADSHTLTADPAAQIAARKPVPQYRCLCPVWPELDVFFTSADEARMMLNTLWPDHSADLSDVEACACEFLERWKDFASIGRMRLGGVTSARSAWARWVFADGTAGPVECVRSRFVTGDVVDLVGAGDAFRAGVLAVMARCREEWDAGLLDLEETIQMGHLMAALYIHGPLEDRCRFIPAFEVMRELVRRGEEFSSWLDLRRAVGG